MTDGRRFRILVVVDDCTRECLALVADTSLSGVRVAHELDLLVGQRGKPAGIVSDNVLCREGFALRPLATRPRSGSTYTKTTVMSRRFEQLYRYGAD